MMSNCPKHGLSYAEKCPVCPNEPAAGMAQNAFAKYSPLDGKKWVGPALNGEELRKLFWIHIWRYNPWTGQERDPRDMASDPRGDLIAPPGVNIWPEFDRNPVPINKIIVEKSNHNDPSVYGRPELPPPADPSALDTQVGGGHYKDMPIQPIEYIHKNGLGFCEGSVVKYVSRWRAKGGVEDLKKARHFLDLLIEMEGGKP